MPATLAFCLVRPFQTGSFRTFTQTRLAAQSATILGGAAVPATGVVRVKIITDIIYVKSIRFKLTIYTTSDTENKLSNFHAFLHAASVVASILRPRRSGPLR